MVDLDYKRYLDLTKDPVAAAVLTLAEAIERKPDSVALTVKQAARSLGVSADTIYDLCRTGRLRHQQIGRTIRIKTEDLDAIKTESVKGGKHNLRCLHA